MTIKEFIDKLKDTDTTPAERFNTLQELIEVSGQDMDTLLRWSEALHDPELICQECDRKFMIPSEYMEEIPLIKKQVDVAIRCPACCENPYDHTYLGLKFANILPLSTDELSDNHVVLTCGRILVGDSDFSNVLAFQGILDGKPMNVWKSEDIRGCDHFIRDLGYDNIVAYDAIDKAYCAHIKTQEKESVVINFHPDNTPEENSAKLSDGTRIEVHKAGIRVIPPAVR